jgi:hypothetical protein
MSKKKTPQTVDNNLPHSQTHAKSADLPMRV